MAASARRIVLCAPLCFVVSKLNRLPSSKIVDAVCDAFTQEEIFDAKKLLMDAMKEIVTDKALPHFGIRRDHDLQIRARKDANDIEAMLAVVDRRKLLQQLPVFAVDNTDKVPTLKLEDGELQYFIARLNKMEMVMESMQGILNRLWSMVNQAMEEEGLAPTASQSQTQETSHRCASVATRAQKGTAPKGVSNRVHTGDHVTSESGRVATDEYANVSADIAVSAGLTPGIISTTGAVVNTGSHINWGDCSMMAMSSGQSGAGEASDYVTSDATTADNDDDDDDGGDYTLVSHNSAKRRRRKSKLQQIDRNRTAAVNNVGSTVSKPFTTDDDHTSVPAKMTYASTAAANVNPRKSTRRPLMIGSLRSPIINNVGSGVNGNALTAAKPLRGTATFCIDNVSTTMTVSDLECYVKSLAVRIIKCNEVKPRRSFRERRDKIFPTDRKAFFLCINRSDTKLLLDADKWPADISISTWFFKKKTDTQNAVVSLDQANDGANATASATGTSLPSLPSDAAQDLSIHGALNLSPIESDDAVAAESSVVDMTDCDHNSTVIVVDLPIGSVSGSQTSQNNGC